MTSPSPQKREAELQKKLDGMSRGSVNYTPQAIELLLAKVDQIKKGRWYQSAELWVALAAAIASCLAAYAAFYPPQATTGAGANQQFEKTTAPAPHTPASSRMP